MAHDGSQDVVQENICLATLFVAHWLSCRECLRATKLEQNVLAYISDFQCRLYEAVDQAKEKLDFSVERKKTKHFL